MMLNSRTFDLSRVHDAVKAEVSPGEVTRTVGPLLEMLDYVRYGLKNSHLIRNRDDNVRTWVKELGHLSALAEDAIDSFFVKIEELRWSERGFKKQGLWDKIKVFKRRKNKTDYRRLVFDEFKSVIDNISEVFSWVKASYEPPDLNVQWTLSDLDDSEPFALEADVEDFTEKLLDQTTSRLDIIPILGLAGCGKTTLARKAFMSNKIKSQFDVRMWLPGSEESEPVDLLKKMLANIRPIEDEEIDQTEEHFMTELNKSLQEKRFLIVINDAMNYNLLRKMVALPGVSNGSIVAITTRFSNIDMASELISEPYVLREPVNERLEILKKTFPNQFNDNYPPNQLDIASRLPSSWRDPHVLSEVFSDLLSDKPLHNLFENDIWGILKGSYDDMSWDLQQCFQYLAFFPEYYEIDAKMLIRLWVAERFITQESSKTMEETAENYLEELAQRFLVIVIRRRYDKSIKTIRIHYLLRHFAIKYIAEEDLSMNPTEYLYRRLSTLRQSVALDVSKGPEHNFPLMEDVGPNRRSIHCFGSKLPDCSDYRLLRVINAEDIIIRYDEITWKRLTQLRFLRAVNVPGFAPGVSSLIYQADQLKNLQTLDIRTCFYFSDGFPEKVWDIKTLRYVRFPPRPKVPGPPSRAHLEDLQVLKYVEDSVSWTTQLPHMPNVRHLKLLVRVSPSLETIASLLKTLRKLVSLRLDLSLNNYEVTPDIVKMQAFPFYQHLRSLTISGVWPKSLALQPTKLPPYLVKLQLHYSYLEKDPMPELGKLQALEILFLHATYTGKKMICSADGFPCLKQLTLSNFSNLEEFEMEEGTMPSLELLKIVGCYKLRSQPKHPSCHIECILRGGYKGY